MNKIVLFTVFYPGAEDYVNDFFESLKAQTRKDFDLLIVNDGYKDSNLQSLCPELNIIELGGTNKISTNREIGINYAIREKYDYLMLCDVDDYFKSQRVELSINAIVDVDIVVNDLDIIDSKRNVIFQNYFSKSIDEHTIFDFEFIQHKNIFGFSNTTLKVSSLDKITFPTDLIIVDWFYFTNLIMDGLDVKFLFDALTEYRQHSDNMIGVATYTLDMFNRLLKFKKKHYLYFIDKPFYKNLYDEMLKIEKLSDIEKEKLLASNEKMTPYPLWWQNVKLN